MDWAEKLVCYIISNVLENNKSDLDTLKRDTSILQNIKPPFPRITYDEAFKILDEKGSDFNYGSDFGAAEETIISEEHQKPVFIHHWPAEIKAFYMKRDSSNANLAMGMDMIAPEGYGELIGGGQREDNLDLLINQ